MMKNFELKVTSAGKQNLQKCLQLFPDTTIVGYSKEDKGLYLHKTTDNCIPLAYPLPLYECYAVVYNWLQSVNSERLLELGFHIDTRPSFTDPGKVLLIYPVDIE